MKPIRIVIIENQKTVRVGIRLLLEKIPGVQVVAEASEVPAALQDIKLHQPDVVLLPGLSGFGRLKRLIKESPGVRVILLSQALRTILRESTYLSSALSKKDAQRNIKHIKTQTTATGLTARQREVLQLIAEERNTKEIAHTLGISVKTVETHRAHLMERLNTRTIAGLVRYAVRMGLVGPEDCPAQAILRRPVTQAA